MISWQDGVLMVMGYFTGFEQAGAILQHKGREGGGAIELVRKDGKKPGRILLAREKENNNMKIAIHAYECE